MLTIVLWMKEQTVIIHTKPNKRKKLDKIDQTDEDVWKGVYLLKRKEDRLWLLQTSAKQNRLNKTK